MRGVELVADPCDEGLDRAAGDGTEPKEQGLDVLVEADALREKREQRDAHEGQVVDARGDR